MHISEESTTAVMTNDESFVSIPVLAQAVRIGGQYASIRGQQAAAGEMLLQPSAVHLSTFTTQLLHRLLS